MVMIKDLYKKAKRLLNPPRNAEAMWEVMTEDEKLINGNSRGDFIAMWNMMDLIYDNPYFTAEGVQQMIGMKGKIICGFPGVGKSTLFKELKDSGYKVLDSDSSTFDKKDFPENYIKHIKEKTAEGYTILASSHDVVRDALLKENMHFTLVYPDKSLKEEYLKRYKERGSPESFIKLLDKNWDKWIKQCDDLKDNQVMKVKLQSGEFITPKKAMIVKTTKKLNESEKTIIQDEMIRKFNERLNSHDPAVKLYKKAGTFEARKGVPGEHIVTTIDGEDETQKTVGEDEVVIKGPKGEMYVVSTKKFNDRYEVDKELTDEFQPYAANGLIFAYEHEGPRISFMASWDEEMICKNGDYLACPVTDPDEAIASEVYRIERSVFDQTYSEVTNYERKAA